MNKKDILRQYVREIVFENKGHSSSVLRESTNDLMRTAVQIALSDSGMFEYSPGSSSRSGSKGIRINPGASLSGLEKEATVAALERAARTVGLEIGEEMVPKSIPSGRSKSISGTFFSWPITNINTWLKGEKGFKYLRQAVQASGRQTTDEDLSNFVNKNALTDEYVVVNSRSLENKLFTGQGLGELAEHATAAAINGETGEVDTLNPTGGFKNAVEGKILRNSWSKSSGNETLRSAFAEAYIKMRDKASSNISKIKNFDFGKATVEGGTGTYDVVTSTCLIHVKFEDPSRLSGLQQKTEDLSKAKKDTPDEDIVFGTADREWKNQRAAFKKALGPAGQTKKDKELLGDWGFYEVLLSGGPYTKINQSTDPDIISWRNSVNPGEIATKLVNDIEKEYGKSQRVDSTGKPFPQFYFGYFRSGDDYRLKIERLDFGDATGTMNIGRGFKIYDSEGRPTEIKNLEIRMNPSYSGREGGTQIGRPYIAVSGNNVIFEIEFRAESSAKPIQLHRGKDFSAVAGSKEGTTMSKVLVNELRDLVRQVLLSEELTSSDKME
ncbi:hypothetical protein, partial [Limnobacter sp.]|uniref:hypothetical protein n=1 Tax=Limnobacter sp. TaxID=2003368 RepID=UPI00311FF429